MPPRRSVRSAHPAALVVASLLSLATVAACNEDKAKPSAPAGQVGAPAASGVDTAQARELIAGGALVVDVREQAEWDQGHLPQARLVPAGTVGDKLGEIEEAASGKDRPIVVHCKAGGRAAKAKAELEAAGFTNGVNGGGYSGLSKP